MTSLKQVGLVLIALMAATLTGCKTKPKNITPIPGGNAGVAGSGSLLGRDSSGTVNGGGDVVTVDQSGNIGLSDLDEFENMLMIVMPWLPRPFTLSWIAPKSTLTTSTKWRP